MGIFSKPKSPPPPPLPPAPPPPPKPTDPNVTRAKRDERRRAAGAIGRGSTILTGSQGLTTEASTARKTLLGT